MKQNKSTNIMSHKDDFENLTNVIFPLVSSFVLPGMGVNIDYYDYSKRRVTFADSIINFHYLSGEIMQSVSNGDFNDIVSLLHQIIMYTPIFVASTFNYGKSDLEPDKKEELKKLVSDYYLDPENYKTRDYFSMKIRDVLLNDSLCNKVLSQYVLGESEEYINNNYEDTLRIMENESLSDDEKYKILYSYSRRALIYCLFLLFYNNDFLSISDLSASNIYQKYTCEYLSFVEYLSLYSTMEYDVVKEYIPQDVVDKL